MERLIKIAIALAVPAVMAGCADDVDNETNASAEEGGDTEGTAEGSATTPSTMSATTNTTPGTTTDEPTTTSPETGDESTGPIPEGCVDGDDELSPRMELAAEITADTTLTCDTVWVLTAATFVRGATLTIDPGTTIIGSSGSALVIDVDATIDAVGQANAPIVFTSAQPKGSRARADWGGVVLLGQAITNLPNGVGQAEGFADPPAYGGGDAAHNCGTMQYVRVEWAGFELVMDNELNGITFYTCGTGTTVDHVQSHMGSDDAFEMFGGAFDATHLVATGMGDDSFDCDLGFEGTIQYALSHQDPAEADGNHGLEWSNGPDDQTAEPLTSPQIANYTWIGQGDAGNPEKSIGFIVKEGTEAHIYNSYFTNAAGPGATIQDESTVAVADGGGIVVQGTFWGTHAAFGHEGDTAPSWTDEMWGDFLLGQEGNMDGVDLALDATWGAPNMKPAADSAAVGGGVTLPAPFEATTYVGAVDPEGTDDWTQSGWINYAID